MYLLQELLFTANCQQGCVELPVLLAYSCVYGVYCNTKLVTETTTPQSYTSASEAIMHVSQKPCNVMFVLKNTYISAVVLRVYTISMTL